MSYGFSRISSVLACGAKLMKTGQTTSYRTGDDGDLEIGRATSFLVLGSNNPYGNTTRFTDELGTQIYTNNIVIDWSTYDGITVLGYRRTLNGSNINWSNAIDGALAVSIGTFTTGWRLPNIYEAVNICNYGNNTPMRYSPFTWNPDALLLWTGTSNPTNTSTALAIQQSGSIVNQLTKTNSSGYQYYPIRTFTVTGTTLT